MHLHQPATGKLSYVPERESLVLESPVFRQVVMEPNGINRFARHETNYDALATRSMHSR